MPSKLRNPDGSFTAAAALAKESATVAAPAAMTSAAATGGDVPTEAEYNLLRADVVALRATVAALLVALKDSNVVATS